MSEKLKPTVAQAKAAWESHPAPSLNIILDVLHKAGFTGMSKSTLQRWKDKDWPEKQRPRGRPALPKGNATVEEIATVKTVTKQVVDEEEAADIAAKNEDEAEAKKLAEHALAALAETNTKESLIAQILLSRRIQRHADKLVKHAPKEAAKLIEALKGPSSNITLVMPNGVEQPAEPKTVGGNVIEHDAGERPMTPLQQSIREFRSQQLKVVK